MGYMTFEQQVGSHLQFLEEAGFKVAELSIDSADFIRCCAQGRIGRGEYAYKTISRHLNNGLTGLMTWCRGQDGRISRHKTYGQGMKELRNDSKSIREERQDVKLRKIQKFWELSSLCGESDYLKRKGVGAHSIRFRENFYGKVAVVPMRSIGGQLEGYQILNSDGSKVFAKGIKMNGLLHSFTKLKDNIAIGIAESYVTAATCFELLPMPMVTAFTGDNMENVAAELRIHYPNSPLVIFADNDRHLAINKGMEAAKKAFIKAEGNGIILAPQFKKSLKNSSYSDWNDLVREIGKFEAFKQIHSELEKNQDDRIKTFFF